MHDYDETKLFNLIDTKNPFIIENFKILNDSLHDLDFEILNDNLDKKVDFFSSDPFIFPESKINKSILEYNKLFMDSKNSVSIFMNPKIINILDINIPNYIYKLFGPLDLFINSSLTISKEYSKTGLMSHNYNKFFVHMIKGNSKIYLFSPSQEIYLHKTFQPNTHKFNCSLVNPWKYDSKKFPDYSKAGYIEITLNEGQILSIPPHWWFYMYDNSDTISLQYYSHNIYTKIKNFF